MMPGTSEIPPATRPGAVHLAVADLDRSTGFYETALGLRVHDRSADRAALGTGDEDLLVLVERPGARSARGFCGLFHVALLVPRRVDLARWLAHAHGSGVPLTGLSDHMVSEAVYLRDPDDHGLEIYADRPREVWEGVVAERMTTLPLDVGDLMSALEDPTTEPFEGLASEPFEGLASGTVVGHVHLCVAEIPGTVAFYRDVLGLSLMASFGRQAAFLAAGGYHHHVGANTWESSGAPQAPAGTARLEQATLVVPGAAARDQLVARVAAAAGAEPQPVDGGVLVRDPSGNPIVLRAAAPGV